MKLTLAIETSAGDYAMILGKAGTAGDDRGSSPGVSTAGEVIAHRRASRNGTSFPSLSDMVSSGLSAVDGRFQDIETIALDIGPGNLSSVRAAVAYANGLAFSLKIKIFCASSLELMAAESRQHRPASPVLCVRNAGAGSAYAGLFMPDGAPCLRHGPMKQLVTDMATGMTEIRVAGDFRAQIAGILAACGVGADDTGIERPDILTLHTMLASEADALASEADAGLAGKADPGRMVSAATPLNEGSLVFHGQPEHS
jgi:tRNA threonylcarbamoyladenosine biosynthesis protein TsaB